MRIKLVPFYVNDLLGFSNAQNNIHVIIYLWKICKNIILQIRKTEFWLLCFVFLLILICSHTKCNLTFHLLILIYLHNNFQVNTLNNNNGILTTLKYESRGNNRNKMVIVIGVALLSSPSIFIPSFKSIPFFHNRAMILTRKY